jgi:lysophospholipase L1-like esterase
MARMRATVLAMALLGFAPLVVPAPAASVDLRLRSELERISRERVYFAHQSVGANLIEGLEDLAAEADVRLRIVQADRAADLPPAAFGHTFVTENGDPLKKLESFRAALGTGAPDLALIKFCFVDIDRDTDVRALFERYQATIAELRQAHPRTVFVHVTVPLTTVQNGFKAWAKRLLDRPPAGLLENQRRDEYNRLVRAAYAGREPLFDLAGVESTTADGRAVRLVWHGVRVPVLLPEYTSDGGHLNAEGRRRAARELVIVLAAARQPQP